MASERLTDKACPSCGGKLMEVAYDPSSMLNEDQWESQIAGKYFCIAVGCTGGREGKTRYRYFWDHDIPAPVVAAPTPPPARGWLTVTADTARAIGERVADIDKRGQPDSDEASLVLTFREMEQIRARLTATEARLAEMTNERDLLDALYTNTSDLCKLVTQERDEAVAIAREAIDEWVDVHRNQYLDHGEKWHLPDEIATLRARLAKIGGE